MKIRGLSYQNGVFFIGKNHISCGYHENGQLKSWLKPLNIQSLFFVMKQVAFAMPVMYKCLFLLYIALVFVPEWLPISWEGLPYYTIFYVMFGTHFIFPKQLRKYHGAEHKVFSTRGIIRRSRIFMIERAAITNRYCSTNAVVIYFLTVILATMGMMIFGIEWKIALELSSYGSVLAVPLISRLMDKKGFGLLKKFILRISYALQVHITTTIPERKHLFASIESYRRLGEVEFPDKVRERQLRKKEEKKMAIIDITIIPIGTETASVSDYVAQIHDTLKRYDDKIKYELTPMSTIIEGELHVLFEVIAAIHEVPFQHGIKRVATNIRIDDRRDQPSTMIGKIRAVEEKLTKETEEQ